MVSCNQIHCSLQSFCPGTTADANYSCMYYITLNKTSSPSAEMFSYRKMGMTGVNFPRGKCSERLSGEKLFSWGNVGEELSGREECLGKKSGRTSGKGGGNAWLPMQN